MNRDKNVYVCVYIWAHVYIWASLVAQLVKNPPANAGNSDLISRSGRSPGGGNSYPLQYSYLENPMDRGAWWAIVYGVAVGPD